ncbi:toxin VasX [Pseudomonas sp. FSL R10-0399]|uniref:toxin VasX n=1 Tax=Pseudomonas sp. FSL R10-0399 TaxID=2662194 RepID=UPI0015B4F88C|nr:toxin VasX [Pseudomonas sp. FSL R10-0399]
MNLDKRLASMVNLSEARRAASACEHVDINSTVQQCPASQPHLFVVPVRYALSEEPASHPACQPGTQTQSHPMAARLLRAGFVYVWQGRGPLQRYAVAENNLLLSQGLDEDDTVVQSGTLSGLALAKQQDAWLLYSEIPLNPAACAELHDPQQRAKRMRLLDLRQVANTLQAPHCAPLSESKSVMAELIPSTYDLAMAIDYRRHQPALRESADELGKKVMADPTPDNIKAYTDAMHWLHEREKVSASYPAVSDDVTPPGEWSAEQWAATRTQDLMEQAHAQSRGLFTVLACLDDDLGVLRDINHEQELIESRHEQWQADNNLRLSIGGFVRSLITEDPDEVIGMLIYRYREQDIELTREQAQMLLDTRTRLEQLARERYAANVPDGSPFTKQQADIRLHEIHLREQAAVAPIRGFIPLKFHDEIMEMVLEYQVNKLSNTHNTHASDKVEQYIDLPAMNQWLDETAPKHFDHLKERHKALYADRGTYLPRHHSGTWFVDYQASDHRQWLDELALACLSAQCLRTVGAEQYADYVRSADDGALRQLFYGWSPTLEGAVNTNSRATELMAALEVENQANAMAALSKALGPQGINILSDLGVRSGNVNSLWNTLLKRLGASLLLLGSKAGEPLQGPWLAIMSATRAGHQIGLRLITQGKHQMLVQFGKAAEDLAQWVNTTGKAIGRGHIAKIVDSPAVKNSGGLIALTALLLNSWNASNYLGHAGVLEGMDQQRIYDTYSATLYAGAALVAVIDSQVRGGVKDKAIALKLPNNTWVSVPVLTLFGGVIGGLSAGAAAMEFLSLQKQIENAHGTIDPWLTMRRNIVGGQVIAFTTQALFGLIYTFRSVSGGLTVSAAVGGYLLWMGPLNLLIAVLGVLYLIAWYFQQTPMQSFLNNCCWAKSRARDLNPINLDAQQDELNRLYGILYVPRISFESEEQSSVMSSLQSGVVNSPVKNLTIDLPGAEPSNVYLELSMVGNPLDTLAMRERIKSGQGKYSPEEPMQDVGNYWVLASRCEWIPHTQGQGLRLSGPFNTVPDLYGSKPTTVFLRLRYNTPLTSMLGLHNFVGGDRGVAFTLSAATGVIALRNDPTPELDIAKRYPLGGQQCSIFLQPGIKR